MFIWFLFEMQGTVENMVWMVEMNQFWISALLQRCQSQNFHPCQKDY